MPLLSKVAVRKFLNRSRHDFSKWRDFTYADLKRCKKKYLTAKPPIWKKLSKTQRACLLLGARFRKFAFFLDTGCGKTLLSIALAKYFRRAEGAQRFLVLVPNIINTAEWAEEIEKHAPKTKYTILEDSTKQKWDDLQDKDCLLYITTYAGFTHMVTQPERNKKKKVKFKQDEKAIRAAVRCLDGIIMDESTLLGNHESIFHLICKKIAYRLRYAWLLTGTPFGSEPTPLWAQMFIIDRGASLGETLALFRAAFYREVEQQFSPWPAYEFRARNAKKVRKMVRHRSLRVEADQADLPKLVSVVKPVRMSSDAEAHYSIWKDKMDDVLLELSRGKLANKQLLGNVFVRMRQISSGFIGYDDDELGERAELVFDDNPKMDLLRSTIESLRPENKFVIFCEYVVSGNLLSQMLTDMKIGHGWIYGKTKDARAVRKRFYEDDQMQGLVLNNSCGGFGLNLQIAQYGFYYESPVDPIMRKQTRRRIERQRSQHKSVFFWDFPVRGTYDNQILESLRRGENLFDTIMSTRIKD